MKALILDKANAPFRLCNVADPVAGPGEVVAKVWSCGAGLTIQHIKAGRIAAQFPRIIGHEMIGEIVELGPGVKQLKSGDVVTAYYYLSCGNCGHCFANLEPLCEHSAGNVGIDCDGAYAEYIKLPARSFIRVPLGLQDSKRAAEVCVITDALATPYKVLRRSRVVPGETAVIFGAGGGLGIHQVLMMKWAGARVIAVDRVAVKLRACRAAGADHVIDASKQDVRQTLEELTDGNGVDVAVDYVSSAETLEAASGTLGACGRMITLGGAGGVFHASALQIMLGEQEILGSRYVSRSDIVDVLRLVEAGQVKPIVTEVVGMDNAESLHRRLEAGEVTGRAVVRICPP